MADIGPFPSFVVYPTEEKNVDHDFKVGFCVIRKRRLLTHDAFPLKDDTRMKSESAFLIYTLYFV